MTILFWVSAAIVVYVYFGYPALLLLLASGAQIVRDLRFGLDRSNRRRRGAAEPPRVSLVVAAHNEEPLIEAKIRNSLGQDYPAGRIEVLIGCDGCTDATATRARAAGLPNVHVFEYPLRAGKPATLNRLVPEARGDIVVFSDANTILTAGSVAALVRHFDDERIGCVCGELRLVPRGGGCESESFYWRFESFLKFLESRLNMMVGANGGIFAIRRELYAALPEGTIIDDFLISMRIRARGYRVVYDPEAVGTEETAPARQEFRRRVRIGAGNLDALRYTWRLLSPMAGLVALSYWSHKVLRWAVPFAMIAGFVSAVGLARQPFYAVMAALAGWFFLLGWIGYKLESGRVRLRAITLPYYFLSINLALLAGFASYVFGRSSSAWRPTVRAGAREKVGTGSKQ